MNVCKCSNKKCNKFSSCKRPKGESIEINYRSICNKNNGYAWYIKEKTDITVYEK